jgi:hypothetical protein
VVTRELKRIQIDGCRYNEGFFVVYNESIKREIKIRPTQERPCDERLTKFEESTRLTYTGFHGELEHLKIKMRLIDEKFVSVMGECVFEKL